MPLQAASGPAGYPVVRGVIAGTETGRLSFQPGDTLLRLGNRDLAGVGATRFTAVAWSEVDEDFRLLVNWQRGAEASGVEYVRLKPVGFPLRTLPLIAIAGMLSLLGLLRGRGHALVRAWSLAGFAHSLQWATFFGPVEWQSNLSLWVSLGAATLVWPLTLRALIRYPGDRAPPFFGGPALAVAVLPVRRAVPHELAAGLALLERSRAARDLRPQPRVGHRGTRGDHPQLHREQRGGSAQAQVGGLRPLRRARARLRRRGNRLDRCRHDVGARDRGRVHGADSHLHLRRDRPGRLPRHRPAHHRDGGVQHRHARPRRGAGAGAARRGPRALRLGGHREHGLPGSRLRGHRGDRRAGARLALALRPGHVLPETHGDRAGPPEAARRPRRNHGPGQAARAARGRGSSGSSSRRGASSTRAAARASFPCSRRPRWLHRSSRATARSSGSSKTTRSRSTPSAGAAGSSGAFCANSPPRR